LLRLEAVEDRTVTSAVLAEPPPQIDLGVVADKPIIVVPTDPVPTTDSGAATPPPESSAADSPATSVPVGGRLPDRVVLPGIKVGDVIAQGLAGPAVFGASADSPSLQVTSGEPILKGVLNAVELERPEDVVARTHAGDTGTRTDKSAARRGVESTTVTPAVTLAPPTADRPASGPEAHGTSASLASPTGAAPPTAGTAIPVTPTVRAHRADSTEADLRADNLPGPEAKRHVRTTGPAVGQAAAGAVERLPADLTDGALLHRFVVDRDQMAFTTLVHRHGSMVLAVCRRVLGDWSVAQDAVQATFLVLARKAAMLDRDGPLGGWLYKVAYHLALRSRAVSARQRQTERDAAEDESSAALAAPGDDLEQQELRQVIREELDRLPEKYREPLILCYFDGRTHADAAREIGLPRGSMAKRIGEGLERLRERLLDRGFML
jgi:RNA polymerase sigma factor (sigma-70 family)